VWEYQDRERGYTWEPIDSIRIGASIDELGLDDEDDQV
jgi:hypothetical protein